MRLMAIKCFPPLEAVRESCVNEGILPPGICTWDYVFKSSLRHLELENHVPRRKKNSGRSSKGKAKERRNSEPLVRLQRDPAESSSSAAKEPRPSSPEGGQSDEDGDSHEHRIDRNHCPVM